jgi:short subunit dehydrogenase-like uncharacterized protein
MTDAPVLVFGATGFTGRMVVKRLLELDLPVRIAGRSEERLQKLSDRHGGLDWVIADVKDPASVPRAADGASVLVTTVGPYTWWGHIAADAAIDQGIPYIDITGEPGWLRKLFDEYSPRAAEAGVPMLPAFGYDYVPGNLAGGIALERAGDAARRVDVGYFLTGQNSRSVKSFSGGTLRSLRASSNEMQFAYSGGRIIEQRGAKKVIPFQLGSRKATAISIGGTEHFTLPRISPDLQEVNVGLGWFGPASRAVSVISAVGQVAAKVPILGGLLERSAGDEKTETPGRVEPVGPNDESRDQARTDVIAVVYDAKDEIIASARVTGPNPYDLTGYTAAWAAKVAAAGEFKAVGTLGPVDAFGLGTLREGCAQFGLEEIELS